MSDLGMTPTEFLQATGAMINIVRVDSRPEQDRWCAGSRHYSVSLTCDGRTMRFYYSQGPGIKSPPRATDIVDCLQCDATCEIGSDVWEFMDAYGYDVGEGRKADAIRKSLIKMQADLLRVLLPAGFAMLCEVES